MYPVASFAECDNTSKQYNLLDMITGRITDDLVDCINKVMEDTTKISASSSTSTPTNYTPLASPQIIPNRYVKPKSD